LRQPRCRHAGTDLSDLWRRIVRALEEDSSIRAATRRFGVSPSPTIKLMQRVRATGSPRRPAAAAIGAPCSAA